MQPLVVVLELSDHDSRKVASLVQQLGKRGLSVQVLRSNHESVLRNAEIVLMAYQPKRIRKLVEQIEQLWHNRWNIWYHKNQKRRRTPARA